MSIETKWHMLQISRWVTLGYKPKQIKPLDPAEFEWLMRPLNHSNEQSLIVSGRKTCDKS